MAHHARKRQKTQPQLPFAFEARTGVYCIRNKVNGKRYIGSSAESIDGRWDDHRSYLRRGKHNNSHLQRAWVKYGEDAFEFIAIERCGPRECLAREQYWIDYHRSAERDFGYNINPVAGSRAGTTHTAEARAKISAANKARSPESRERHAALLRGRKHSKEHCAKIAASNMGRKFSDETRAKISAANKARRAANRRTHCPHGHEMTQENSYIYKGSKCCKTCRRQNVIRWRMNRK